MFEDVEENILMVNNSAIVVICLSCQKGVFSGNNGKQIDISYIFILVISHPNFLSHNINDVNVY